MAFLADLMDEWKKLNTPGKIAVGGALVGIAFLAYANRKTGVTGSGVTQGTALANGTGPFATNVTATGTPTPSPVKKPVIPPSIIKIIPKPLPFKPPPKYQGGKPPGPISQKIWPQPTGGSNPLNLHGVADSLSKGIHPIEQMQPIPIPGGIAWGSGINRRIAS